MTGPRQCNANRMMLIRCVRRVTVTATPAISTRIRPQSCAAVAALSRPAGAARLAGVAAAAAVAAAVLCTTGGQVVQTQPTMTANRCARRALAPGVPPPPSAPFLTARLLPPNRPLSTKHRVGLCGWPVKGARAAGDPRVATLEKLFLWLKASGYEGMEFGARRPRAQPRVRGSGAGTDGPPIRGRGGRHEGDGLLQLAD